MVSYPVGCPDLGSFEAAAVSAVIQTGRITHGPMVRRFESQLAERLAVGHVVACSSGTTALHLACAALGLGPGDEVLVPDITYVASANAVTYTGAKPVLVDVLPGTWNIDLTAASFKVTSRTKAILPVHLYGVPCNMDEMRQFADFFGLAVVEDAAEALGGDWNGKACGTFGECGTFSFYGNKIITTGEGGAVVTDDESLADRLRLLRGQGQTPNRQFWHECVGFNYRMTDLHAAVGVIQLSRFDEMLERRSSILRFYRRLVGDVVTSFDWPGTAPWLFTGLLPEGVRYEDVAPRMLQRGIETRPVFVPLHRLPMYRQDDAVFPVASSIVERGISLPTHSQLTERDTMFISSVLYAVLAEVYRDTN